MLYFVFNVFLIISIFSESLSEVSESTVYPFPQRTSFRSLRDVVGLTTEEIMLTSNNEARERLKVAVLQLKAFQKEILLLKRKYYRLTKTNVFIRQKGRLAKAKLNVSKVCMIHNYNISFIRL